MHLKAALFIASLMAPHAMAQEHVTIDAELAIFMTITAQPGKRADLVALWDKHLKPQLMENDTQPRYVYALDMADPDTIRVAEVYATQAAFEANAQAPWFGAFIAEAGPLLANEPAFHMATPHWVK